jgi:hypothetical protein
MQQLRRDTTEQLKGDTTTATGDTTANRYIQDNSRFVM